MNNTQNQKIAQVTDKTLIVGVDIGSENHYARAILARGFEVSKKPFPFPGGGASCNSRRFKNA